MKLKTALIVAGPPAVAFSSIAIFNPSVLTWPVIGFLVLVVGVFAAFAADLFE